MKKNLLLLGIVGFIVALFIRLMLIPNSGFEADVSFWKSWGLAVVDYGLVKGLRLTNFNYPTPFAYFLFFMVKIYSLFADPHTFNAFWQNNNLLFLFVSKMPAIIADFGIAGIFLWIGKNAKRLGFPALDFRLYGLFALVYLFNPISIIDGAWWGQLDSLGVLLFLLAILALLGKKPFLAGVIYMISMMTKLQNMIYGPIFFLFLWEYLGFFALVRAVGGAILTFVGLNIEYIAAHDFGRVVESLVGNYNYFPWLSLNAFNPWWIVSGAQGMKVSDKVLTIGLVNAKTVGLYLFSAGYLFAVLQILSKKSKPIYAFFTALIIANASFFLFQTESHDRYAFPLIIFLLLWAPFAVDLKKNWKWFFGLYGLFSLVYFYNLHTALVFNYPKNGIPVLTALTQPVLTIAVSYFFTAFFIWFLLFLGRDTHIVYYILPLSLIAVGLLAKNLPIATQKPVYLTSITPIAYKQDWGDREVDMPTDAFLGYTRWSRLSVQYSFYYHGIGTHANGYQTYDIGGLFRTFSFDYGIDTQAGPQGTVTFEVWGDSKLLFASKKIGRYEYPRHADVAVTGVHKLELKVTDAGDGNTDDHADWLNPKLYE